MVSIARTVFVADMSITIHLEEFQSWSEVFGEIERQRKMMLFEIIRPNPSAIHDREKKRRSLLRVGEGRCFSEREKNHLQPSQVQPGRRSISTPCTTRNEIKLDNPDGLLYDSRFTDAARKLSKEEMELLYLYIVEPVNVYSIFLGNRKEMTGHGH